MKLIVATDIFGKTPELEILISNFSNSYSNTIIIDPYHGEYIDFKDESEAYAHFQHYIGLTNYTDLVMRTILNYTNGLTQQKSRI